MCGERGEQCPATRDGSDGAPDCQRAVGSGERERGEVVASVYMFCLHEACFKQEIVHDGITVLMCFIWVVLQVTVTVCSRCSSYVRHFFDNA